MELKEVYEKIGGDYDDVVRRFVAQLDRATAF